MKVQVHLQIAAVCALQLAFAECVNPVNVVQLRSRLAREIRFTKFNMTITNPSVGTVNECGIRSLRNKHMLFLRFNIIQNISDFHGEFYFYKCKEYYLDCQTVVSYNVTNGCSKLDVFTYYTRFDSSFQKINKCPLYGEYAYSNFTVNAEEFGTMFSYPLERWWELYWRIRVKIYDQNFSEFIVAMTDLYILEYRIRYH